MKQIPDELLQQIVQRLVDALHPLQIWLFGSHASGRTHQHSDLDLMLVVPDDAGELDDLTAQGYRALRHMGIPKDLMLFYQRDMRYWAPVKFSLPYEATRNGRLLYAAEQPTRATVA